MSGTSPRPLSLITPSESSPVQILAEMENLVAWCLQDQTLSIYKPRVSNEDSHALFLLQDGFTKLILGPNVYTNPETLESFLSANVGPMVSIICAGDDQQLSALPLECLQQNVQRLGLPSTTSNFRACIETTHSFQIAMANSRAERDVLEETTENVKYVMSISRELNGERDIPKLLNLILQKAREISKADAGSIYTIEYPPNSKKLNDARLRFRFTQNTSIKTDLSEFTVPIDNKSIVGNAVLHQAPINIPDLYKLNDDPSLNPYGVRHNRTFDARSGYQSHSMLTLPMFDISYRPIGVIQLINRKRDFNSKLLNVMDFEKQVVAFSEHDEEYAQIVAQQAGIALENAEMHNEIQRLFDGFVNASVTAIEQRDPTTSGHSHRVAKLTTELARCVDQSEDAPFKEIRFSDDEMREIEYASLLHDFGKLGVRENVLVKARKLYPWQYETVQERFDLIRASLEIDYLRQLVNFMNNPMAFSIDFNPDNLKAERDVKMLELDDFFKFVANSNEPTVLPQGGFERLNDIAKLTFKTMTGSERQYLTAEELKALSVSRGSLTAEEFAEIQSHVTHTYEFLRKIPWGHRLANVPEIAAKHHEKLDGTGYPLSASGSQIPIQSRMMSIADIYDALTASDRPYKKAVPSEKALDIIHMEVKGGKVDQTLFDLFVKTGTYKIVLEKSR